MQSLQSNSVPAQLIESQDKRCLSMDMSMIVSVHQAIAELEAADVEQLRTMCHKTIDHIIHIHSLIMEQISVHC